MAAVPYEILNSLEWVIDGEGFASGFAEDEDEWADGRSISSNSVHTTLFGTEHQSSGHRLQPSNLQTQTGNDSGDSKEWTTISRATKGKTVQQPETSVAKAKLPARPAAATTPTKSFASAKPRTVVKQVPQRQTATQKSALAQTFHFPRDNAAKVAYRNRQPANGRYILHKDVGEIESNQPKLYSMLERLGIRFRTFLRPPQGPTEREILMWGEQHAIDRTIRSVNEWERNVEAGPVPVNSKARGTFAAVKSSATHTYQRGIQRLDREAAFKAYQQLPEPGKHFPFQGWVIWDIDEASPIDVFGVSLEAFDPIRRQKKCHITYEDSSEALRVLGDKKDHVDDAVRRIQTAIESLRTLGSRDLTKFFVDMTFPSSMVYEDVVLVNREPTPQATLGPVIPFSHGNSMKASEKAKWMEECQVMDGHNQHEIESALKSVIPSLRYKSGQIHIRILFGTFGLTKFPLGEENKKSLPLRSFLDRMNTPGVKGELTRDLRIRQSWDNVTDHLKTSDLFEAMDSTSEASHIQARFVINRVDKPAVRYVRNVRRSITDTYDLEAGRWMRDDGRDSRAPLQVFMTQLDGKTSWKLQVSAHQKLHDSYVDSKMAFFAESLVFDCKDIKNVHRTGRKQFSFRSDAQILKPSLFEQKTSCHYRLANAPEWAVEISRFDRYRPDSELPITTNWSASMLNLDWDSTLSSNERLKIGEHAQWEAKLETFLQSPDPEGDDKGTPAVGRLLQTIRTVTSFLDEMRKM